MHYKYYITYLLTLPAFADQLMADDRNRIGAISRKALRRGVTHTAFDIEEIIDSAIIANFLPVLPNPVTVYHLLPPNTCAYYPYSLRKRQHSYELPYIEFSQYKTVLSIDVCLDSDD